MNQIHTVMSRPLANTTARVFLENGYVAVFGFSPEEGAFERVGDDLFIIFEDNSILAMEGYFVVDSSARLPHLVFADGYTISGEEFLDGLGIDTSPSAGPVQNSVTSRDNIAYDYDPGVLIDGVGRLGGLDVESTAASAARENFLEAMSDIKDGPEYDDSVGNGGGMDEGFACKARSDSMDFGSLNNGSCATAYAWPDVVQDAGAEDDSISSLPNVLGDGSELDGMRGIDFGNLFPADSATGVSGIWTEKVRIEPGIDLCGSLDIRADEIQPFFDNVSQSQEGENRPAGETHIMAEAHRAALQPSTEVHDMSHQTSTGHADALAVQMTVLYNAN